ncbi:MAG: imidazoleglycerol-phosphate dehydratase HisB [Chloroflexi bacterium]|nr:imidazoleglycerol-phosphate dehydratase HisB [Chloroflexota bacterium]
MADKKVAKPAAKKVVKPVTKPVAKPVAKPAAKPAPKEAPAPISKYRSATVSRATGETKVSVELTLDGKGVGKAKTGIGMLDHLIEQIARHGLFDIAVEAKGDLKTGQHHTLEDVAICLGQAFDKALGDRKSIARMGHAVVPMDETLSLVAIDISGRGFGVVEAPIEGKDVGGLDTDLIKHFLQTFATEAKLTLHARLLAKGNDHHKVECLFKALAKSLDSATKIDERVVDIPSTKGKL